MVIVQIEYTVEEVPGKGWLADAPKVKASAQGETMEEALANLKELVSTYPEVLEPLYEAAKSEKHPQLELIPA
jgi:predicted RNase H-like HicB family nuclease